MKLFSKRLLALLLTVLMVIQMLPVSALAEGDDPSDVTESSSVSTSSSGDSDKSTEPKSDKEDGGSSEGGKPDGGASAGSGSPSPA